MVDRELDRIQAHKGSIGDTQGARGDLPQISRNWEKSRGTIFKGVWGKTGFPKGLLGTIQSIWVAGNPMISNLGTIPLQNHVFWVPFLARKPPRATLGQPSQEPGPAKPGQEPPRGIRTLRNKGGVGCRGRLEEVQGGGQQEGRQGSHTPANPKGLVDDGKRNGVYGME